jgi:SAM-dependent methyltransferase
MSEGFGFGGNSTKRISPIRQPSNRKAKTNPVKEEVIYISSDDEYELNGRETGGPREKADKRSRPWERYSPPLIVSKWATGSEDDEDSYNAPSEPEYDDTIATTTNTPVGNQEDEESDESSIELGPDDEIGVLFKKFFDRIIRRWRDNLTSGGENNSISYAGIRKVGDQLHEMRNFTSNSVFADIGSGAGIPQIYIALKYGCHTYGIERDLKLVNIADGYAREAGVSHLCTFEHKDIEDLKTDTTWFSDRRVTHLFTFDGVFDAVWKVLYKTIIATPSTIVGASTRKKIKQYGRFFKRNFTGLDKRTNAPLAGGTSSFVVGYWIKEGDDGYSNLSIPTVPLPPQLSSLSSSSSSSSVAPSLSNLSPIATRVPSIPSTKYVPNDPNDPLWMPLVKEEKTMSDYITNPIRNNNANAPFFIPGVEDEAWEAGIRTHQEREMHKKEEKIVRKKKQLQAQEEANKRDNDEIAMMQQMMRKEKEKKKRKEEKRV